MKQLVQLSGTLSRRVALQLVPVAAVSSMS